MDHLSRLTVLALPFSIVVSAAYLRGFWNEFDVDVFTYLSVQEIAVQSAIPLMGTGLMLVVGSFLGMLPERTKEKETNIKKWKLRTRWLFRRVLDLSFVGGCVLMLLYGGAGKWIFLPNLILWGGMYLIFRYYGEFLRESLTISRSSVVTFFLAVLLGVNAFGYGKYKALSIKNGERFKYVLNSDPSFDRDDPTSNRYIGNAGGFYFVYQNKDQIVLAFQHDQLTPLKLKKKKLTIQSLNNADEKAAIR